jgi:hypothetical protein
MICPGASYLFGDRLVVVEAAAVVAIADILKAWIISIAPGRPGDALLTTTIRGNVVAWIGGATGL